MPASRLSSLLLALLFLVLSGYAPASQAQEAAADNQPAAVPPPANEIREQTIYIPYTKLREVFEKEGRGVFLPYDKFQELWKQAQERQPRPADIKAPVGAVITAIESEATVAGEMLTVKATVRIDALTKGWHYVPLRLRDAALQRAEFEDGPARVTFDPETGYRLLLRHPDDETKPYTLTLEYAKAVTKSPGQNSVAFEAPQAPVNRWQIRIPQAGAKVNIQPFLAATEAPPEGDAPDEAPREETVMLAFVGAAPQVRIDWTPKAEGAAGLEALATVQTTQEVTVEEGLLRIRATLDYEIRRAELTELNIELPAELKVVGVFDANVRTWKAEAADDADTQTLTIQLFDPAKGAQRVVLDLERFQEDLWKEEIWVPVVKALQVGRQQGRVLVRVGSELQAEPIRRTGLIQTDVGEAPSAEAAAPWTFAYRYVAVPFELVFRAEKVLPRLRLDELVEAYLEPEQLVIDWLGIFEIERAGVFQFELKIPAGLEVRQVRGREAAGAQAAAVESFQATAGDEPTLRVNLTQKALGRIGLWIQLQRRLDDPNLLRPTGAASTIELDWPRAATGSVERESGRLVVYAPESLRLNPQTLEGVRAVSVPEALQGTQSLREGRFPHTREVLALAFSEGAAQVTLNAERRKPQVTMRQVLVARLEAGVVKYEASFLAEILYSGIKTLRVDIPQAISGDLRNLSRGIRDKVLDPQPDDVAAEDVAWSFTGESEFLGNIEIKLAWEQKLQELEIGQSQRLTLPVLQPREVDRSWGQIVLTKAEALDVQPAEDHAGLRPIDPQHDLMAEAKASVPAAALAFEFHDAWHMSVTVTRYELQEVKRTSIERAVLRTVVTRSDQVAVQGLYRIRSAHQRLAIVLPADVILDSEALRLNGKPVGLEKGDQDRHYVPLIGQSPDQPFLLELRYSVPGNQTRLDFPVFSDVSETTDDTAVQKVYLCVYLPQEWALLVARGPWDDEQSSQWYARWGGIRAPSHSDAELVNWVREGISVANDPLQGFQTDGTLNVFSTLRPPPPPDGALRLTTLSENQLNGLIFGGLALLGLVLLPARWSVKCAALALLVISVVLTGVFLPTLALRLINGQLVAAVGLVAFVWMLGSVARMPAVRARRPVAATATTTPSTTPPSGSASAAVRSPDSPFRPGEQPGTENNSLVQGTTPGAGSNSPEGTPGTEKQADEGDQTHA